MAIWVLQVFSVINSILNIHSKKIFLISFLELISQNYWIKVYALWILSLLPDSKGHFH